MRKFFMILLLAGGLLGALTGALRAQSPEEQIVASLAEQGYSVVLRDRTWLGRIWLVVENGEIRREIVFNPGTGEILRDYAVLLALAVPTSGRNASHGATASGAVTHSDKSVAGVSGSVVADAAPRLGEALVVLPASAE